jgi:hypothetical protein
MVMEPETQNLPAKSSSRGLGSPPRHLRRVSELVARLMNHYWTANDPAAMRQAQIEDWIEDLIELPIECVEEACREWRRTGHRRPLPSEIRILAIAEQRRRNPPPESVYLPPPEPRIEDPVERAEMARRMGELARIVTAGLAMPTADDATPRPAAHENPDALRRGRVALGLEEEPTG